MSARLLFVDDDPIVCAVTGAELTQLGYNVTTCHSAGEALATLAASPMDVVVTDINMKGVDGLELCGNLAENQPDLPVIVLTGHGTMEVAIRAIRAGAYDFLTKPVQAQALHLAVSRALEHSQLRSEVKRLRQQIARRGDSAQMVGKSPAMAKVFSLIERVAKSDVSVLVTGETGTGKELVAKELHGHSKRSSGPFVTLNCAAVPEALLESELFGHVRGAFTDARNDRLGIFAQAHKGTLFLDEIGEMPVSLQPKLLRALQEKVIRPVGATKEQAVDVRIVAATNRDLEKEVAEGAFREDLYFRINVLQLELPPLRARGNDVLLLAQRFATVAAERMEKEVIGISTPAAERLLAHTWPGNVRELQNCMERAVALTNFEEITVADLPDKIATCVPSRGARQVDRVEEEEDFLTLEAMERRHIFRALDATGGNKTSAAQMLGLDRATLYRKLDRYRKRAAKEASPDSKKPKSKR